MGLSTTQAFDPGVGLSRARIHDPSLCGVGLFRVTTTTSLCGVGLSRARIHDPSLCGVGLFRVTIHDPSLPCFRLQG